MARVMAAISRPNDMIKMGWRPMKAMPSPTARSPARPVALTGRSEGSRNVEYSAVVNSTASAA